MVLQVKKTASLNGKEVGLGNGGVSGQKCSMRFWPVGNMCMQFRDVNVYLCQIHDIFSPLVYWNYGACVCYLTGGLLLLLPMLLLWRVDISDKTAGKD